MFGFGSKKNKKTSISEGADTLNQVLKEQVLSESLDENVSTMKKLFEDDNTITIKTVKNSQDESLVYCIAFCDGVSSAALINEHIIEPLILSEVDKTDKNVLDTLMQKVLHVNEIKKTDSMKDIVEAVTYGDTILFVDKSSEALILNSKGFQTRGIEEPDSEKALSGPKEGFTESLMVNISMLHRKLRTNELKLKFQKIGKRTSTNICICYINGIVNKDILNELNRRIASIDIDAILESNYLVEMIRDTPMSLYQTVGSTERPDVLAGNLLEGRIGIIVDGSPKVITVPFLFVEYFQTAEDYFLPFYQAALGRFFRMVGFFLTITVPALYIAVVAYHHEMLPTPLLISIAIERASVPLPAALEAFVMLLVFDLLKETGVRMPSSIGTALSIVGALVIGQAAVEAEFVAAPMIIVVGITGITSLLIPKMSSSIIYTRMFLLLAASTLGLLGLILGLSCVFIHILNLTSFGVPLLTTKGRFQYQDVKDTLIRAPWRSMVTRPKTIAEDTVRMRPRKGN